MFNVDTGVRGGLLFEHFVVVFGKRTSRRAMSALIKLCDQEQRECTDAESAALIRDERVGFCCSVLCGLANRGRSANRQLFFFTLLAQARGLSRTGMEVFHGMNVCLSPRSFDLELGTFMSTVAEQQRCPRRQCRSHGTP